jgi:hypothetical protein
MIVEGVALDSVLLVSVGSTTHCVGEHDCLEYCSDHCSLVRRVLSQPLWWRARQVRSLLWPLFARLARAQPATVVAGTAGECDALVSVRSVCVDPSSHCGGGCDR